MLYVFALLILPVAWIILAKFIWHQTISTKEMLIQFAVTIVFTMTMYYVSKANLTDDTEILNGMVVEKDNRRVSCSHSYQCHCYTTCSGSGKSRHCSRRCRTCYDHSYDINWNVYTTVGDLQINRTDRQGLVMPPRWDQVQIGEHAALEHNFTNYVKGAKFSMFNYKDKVLDAKFAKLIPSYPRVHDYYRVNRVIPVGILIPNAADINHALNQRLTTLGTKKKANIVVVIANTTDPTYRYALEKQWIGGKINDIIVVIGMTEYPHIEWSDVITIGKNSGNTLLQVKMRDNLTTLKSIDNVDIGNVIADTIDENFKRKNMEDFKYLENEIQPSMRALIIIAVLLMLSNIGLTIFFHKQEI